MLAKTLPYFSGTRFPAAGGRMLRGRAGAGMKQPFVMATQLLFIFMAVHNTGQCLCLDFFFPLKQSKRAFHSCGGMKGRAVFNSVSILPHIYFHLLEFEGVLAIGISLKKNTHTIYSTCRIMWILNWKGDKLQNVDTDFKEGSVALFCKSVGNDELKPWMT